MAKNDAASLIGIEDFMTDETKEREGVEIQLGGGTWVKVASSHSDAYLNKLSELLEANQMLLDLGGSKADELAKEALYTAAAEHLLKDWNMTMDGKSVKYTPKVGIAAFYKAPRFYKMIKSEADNLARFALKKEEEEAKN